MATALTGVIGFQYISCYCLSKLFKSEPETPRVFQYISCYCLSFPIRLITSLNPYFNTSHVTVYRAGGCCGKRHSWFQYISCYCLSWILQEYCLCCRISIHLMLLFICTIVPADMFIYKFQYISCYCLSIFSAFPSFQFFHFNTSHVTVYRGCVLQELCR